MISDGTEPDEVVKNAKADIDYSGIIFKDDYDKNVSKLYGFHRDHFIPGLENQMDQLAKRLRRMTLKEKYF